MVAFTPPRALQLHTVLVYVPNSEEDVRDIAFANTARHAPLVLKGEV